jgi:hypothetical protein
VRVGTEPLRRKMVATAGPWAALSAAASAATTTVARNDSSTNVRWRKP